MPASRMTSTSSQRLARAEPGHVRVGQLVDQGDGRLPGDDRVGVHLLDDHAAVLDPAARNDLEPVEQLDRVRPAVGLDEADDEVRAAGHAAMALVEHLEGLADARRHAEVDAEAAARARRLGLDPRQHLVRRRADVERVALGVGHCEQAVQVEVEHQDVDARLAEEAEERLLGVAGDRRADVVLGQPAGRRRPAPPGTRPRPG